MAKLFYGMNQSLDGYVDHTGFAPGPTLFRHFIEQTAGLAGSIYGRRLYEIMRYWDDEQPDWDAAEREFAAAWRSVPKWVASRTLKTVGPNATLIEGDIETAIGRLKNQQDGEMEIGGTVLAGSLADTGLIDEYRIYLHPVVLGGGTPFFAHARSRLRLVDSQAIGDAMRLSYVPA